MKTGILSTIKQTPLIRLDQLFRDEPFELFAKLEMFNPGGSIKDRAALKIIETALEQGQLRPGMTVIESTSGNMGIGLAQVCAYYGLRFICVVDPRTTAQNINILKTYGAEVEIVTEPSPIDGGFLQARIDRVQKLLATIPGSFWTNQYANLANAAAHQQTMQEIVQALDGQVDYLFCATSTCGTLRGCADYVRAHQLNTKIYAVDALGSVIFSRSSGPRLVPGHGAARRPELFHAQLADQHILMSDLDCVVGCRRLLSRETILAGGSSGAVTSAIDQLRATIPAGAHVVMIVCDRGERYLDTIYNDDWVETHFGDVGHLFEPHSYASA